MLTARMTTKLLSSYAAVPDVGSASQLANDEVRYDLEDGTGAGQAQKYYQDKATIAASGSATLDLNGAINDIFGAVLNLTNIKVLRIRAASTNTNDVVVGGAASNPFIGPFADATDKIAIKPGGELFLIAPNAGYAVVAGTGDQLKIANSGAGTGVDYTIEIVGY